MHFPSLITGALAFGAAIAAPLSNSSTVGIDAIEPAGSNDLGNVYYDPSGHIRLYFTYFISAKLADLSQNSGFNFAADMSKECQRWILKEGGFDNIIRGDAMRAVWGGAIDAHSRYLRTNNALINYATIAIDVTFEKSSPFATIRVAKLAAAIATWVNSYGTASVQVIPTGNAFYVGIPLAGQGRRDVGEKTDFLHPDDTIAEDALVRRTNSFCAKDTPKFYGTQKYAERHTPRPLYYYFDC